MIPKKETKKKELRVKVLPEKAPNVAIRAYSGTAYKRDFVMVTFGYRDQEVFDALKAKATELGWMHSTLAKEIIRKYLGFPTYL
jgi:hypothetical protein